MFFIIIMLFTFSRSECPCPKTFTGRGQFDADQHWMVRDFSIRKLTVYFYSTPKC
jgi:hypothetical protein